MGNKTATGDPGVRFSRWFSWVKTCAVEPLSLEMFSGLLHWAKRCLPKRHPNKFIRGLSTWASDSLWVSMFREQKETNHFRGPSPIWRTSRNEMRTFANKTRVLHCCPSVGGGVSSCKCHCSLAKSIRFPSIVHKVFVGNTLVNSPSWESLFRKKTSHKKCINGKQINF